jgi:hypothetical protein
MKIRLVITIILICVTSGELSAQNRGPTKWNWFSGLGINIGTANFIGSAKYSVRNSDYTSSIQTYSFNWYVGCLSGSDRVYAFISAGYIGDNPYTSEEPWSGGELVVIETGYSKRITPWKFLTVNPGVI